MTAWKTVEVFVKKRKGKLDAEKYVVLVSQTLYQQLINESNVPSDEIVYMYCDGVIIMWDVSIKSPIFITKDVFNTKYNKCSFWKLR